MSIAFFRQVGAGPIPDEAFDEEYGPDSNRFNIIEFEDDFEIKQKLYHGDYSHCYCVLYREGPMQIKLTMFNFDKFKPWGTTGGLEDNFELLGSLNLWDGDWGERIVQGMGEEDIYPFEREGEVTKLYTYGGLPPKPIENTKIIKVTCEADIINDLYDDPVGYYAVFLIWKDDELIIRSSQSSKHFVIKPEEVDNYSRSYLG